MPSLPLPLPGGWVIPEGVVEGAQRLDGVEVPHRDGLGDVGFLERQDALHIFREEIAVELEVLRVIPEPIASNHTVSCRKHQHTMSCHTIQHQAGLYRNIPCHGLP